MPHPLTIADERDRQRVVDLIAKLNLEKPWEVTVARKTKKRTLSQNGLYHQWVGIIAEETGNDHEDVHDEFKRRWVPPKEIEIFGEKRMRQSTTDFDTRGMTDYMEKVYAFSVGELGILLPLPEEQHDLPTSSRIGR